MALYYKIQEAYGHLRTLEKDNRDLVFQETDAHRKAIELEGLLADRFDSPLEQYNQGLISASELFTKLYLMAYEPVDPSELGESEA